jgi:hypothetical protein
VTSVADESNRIAQAVLEGRCSFCWEGLGQVVAFLAEPIAAVERVSNDPPLHRGCAEFSAGHRPGIALVWVTQGWSTFRPLGGRRILFRMGEPLACSWYAGSLAATREQVIDALESSLAKVRELAALEGPAAAAALDAQILGALSLVPR